MISGTRSREPNFRPEKMPKNIVVCCDGTGNEFGSANSNVIRLYSVLDLRARERQVAYYHPGLGTMGAPSALTKFTKWWTRLFGLAFGRGLLDDVGEAYEFLMNEYQPGDQIFLFGFSRGAYTARALAGMIHMFGLVRRGEPILIRYVARMFRIMHRDVFHIAAEFKNVFSIACRPHFVGVWDTVSSIGWIYDPWKLPYTANNPDVGVVRHAVSIDERRCFFWQNLWGPGLRGQDIKQVWFAGVHSDVGGGYPELESGLAKISLRWMLREASSAGLLVDQNRAAVVLGRSDDPMDLDFTVVQHESLKAWWWIPEFLPRRYIDTARHPPSATFIIPRGARRRIPDGSLIHDSVRARLTNVPGYTPQNLPIDHAWEH